MKALDHIKKLALLGAILGLYLIIASTLLVSVNVGVLARAPAPPVIASDLGTDTDPTPIIINQSEALVAATAYVDHGLRLPNGHIDLYKPLSPETMIPGADDTNSEAVSYYLEVAAQQGDKARFDNELTYVEHTMLHPAAGYLMWRLDANDTAVGDGSNIAPDADLRALHALYTAKDRWGDPRYDTLIDTIASALESVAITSDQRIAAYGGVSGNGFDGTKKSYWHAQESYLSYTDFQVVDRLADTRQGVWPVVALRMRNITLDAQLWNGLYNQVYFADGRYGNGVDGGAYSINSMWIMVRFSESNDPVLMESARKSLAFYQEHYREDGHLYASYTSSGDIASKDETPWTYALVGRAASALGEQSFATIMESKMRSFQQLDPRSPVYGAFIEGSPGDERISQFTTQESILTMQEMQGLAQRFH